MKQSLVHSISGCFVTSNLYCIQQTFIKTTLPHQNILPRTKSLVPISLCKYPAKDNIPCANILPRTISFLGQRSYVLESKKRHDKRLCRLQGRNTTKCSEICRVRRTVTSMCASLLILLAYLRTSSSKSVFTTRLQRQTPAQFLPFQCNIITGNFFLNFKDMLHVPIMRSFMNRTCCSENAVGSFTFYQLVYGCAAPLVSLKKRIYVFTVLF